MAVAFGCSAPGGSSSVPEAGLLAGDPSSPATEAYEDRDEETGVDPSEIVDGVARTRLVIWFEDGILVGDANAVLVDHDAVITSMVRGDPVVLVRIPDPQTRAEQDRLVVSIAASPAVRAAWPESITLASEVPEHHQDLESATVFEIRHLLSLRMPAAHNARRAIVHTPTLYVVDEFGDGLPGDDFAVDPLAAHGFFDTPSYNSHGYHVLGLITGTFGGPDTKAGRVTGTYPGRIPVRVDDAINNPLFTSIAHDLLRFLRTQPGNVVANVSRYDGKTIGDEDAARTRAAAWIQSLAQLPGAEQRYLHVNAAGNFAIDAGTTTAFNAAALLEGLFNLTNTIAVENGVAAEDLEAGFPVACLNKGSSFGGDLTAVGTRVWSMLRPTTDAGFKSGTSMSAPQVAGLAAYLWAIRPDLESAEVIEILKKTARPVTVDASVDSKCTADRPPAPVPDAYAAVLALDTWADPRVRTAILDANGDGVFDQDDTKAIVARLETFDGTLDHSIYDLNGDGRTGGVTTAPFDLDLGSETLLSIDLGGETLDFDEAYVTDLDVVCYYAYSELFQGPDTERSSGCALNIPEAAVFSGRATYEDVARPAWATVESDDGQLDLTFGNVWQGLPSGGRWRTETRRILRTPSGGFQVDGRPAIYSPSGELRFSVEVRAGVIHEYRLGLVEGPADVSGTYDTTYFDTAATVSVVQSGSSIMGTIHIPSNPPTEHPIEGAVFGRTFGAGDGCIDVTGTIDGPDGTLVLIDGGEC